MDRQERKAARQARRAERRANRKPFFETKAGGVLKGVATIVAPNLVNALEGVDSVTDALQVINGSGESEETKITLRELTIREYEIEVMDRTSAREREVRVLEAGGNNHLMDVLGWGVTLAFLGMAGILMGLIPLGETVDREYLLFGAGAVSSAFMTVLAYFFGSSQGSKQKTFQLSNRD